MGTMGKPHKHWAKKSKVFFYVMGYNIVTML